MKIHCYVYLCTYRFQSHSQKKKDEWLLDLEAKYGGLHRGTNFLDYGGLTEVPMSDIWFVPCPMHCGGWLCEGILELVRRHPEIEAKNIGLLLTMWSQLQGNKSSKAIVGTVARSRDFLNDVFTFVYPRMRQHDLHTIRMAAQAIPFACLVVRWLWSSKRPTKMDCLMTRTYTFAWWLAVNFFQRLPGAFGNQWKHADEKKKETVEKKQETDEKKQEADEEEQAANKEKDVENETESGLRAWNNGTDAWTTRRDWSGIDEHQR